MRFPEKWNGQSWATANIHENYSMYSMFWSRSSFTFYMQHCVIAVRRK